MAAKAGRLGAIIGSISPLNTSSMAKRVPPSGSSVS